LASAWSAPIEKRFDAPVPLIIFRVVTAVGIVLLFVPFSPHRVLFAPLWQVGEGTGWVLAGLAAAGILFTWWARIHLGDMWSSAVVKKIHHHVVETGPYRLVRHPIYTGILSSAWATAAAKSTAAALLGAVIMTIGFYLKGRVEERFLRAELGRDVYESYVRRVPMLVPFPRL
jgi:protein-S-isoprenylcysteine O-methyltransferase Ste14